MESSGQNTGVSNFSLLQGILPTKGLNPGAGSGQACGQGVRDESQGTDIEDLSEENPSSSLLQHSVSLNHLRLLEFILCLESHFLK